MKRYYRKGDVQKYLFVLQDCEDVRFENVTIQNAPLWNVRLQDCTRVWIRGIHLWSDLERGVNSDGIDIVSSSHVCISDSIIATADDAICLKTTGLGERGTGTVRPTENVVVNNCILTSSSTPMMIGTETHADIRQVLFSNIIVRNSNKVFGINVQDGATVSDVRLVNVTNSGCQCTQRQRRQIQQSKITNRRRLNRSPRRPQSFLFLSSGIIRLTSATSAPFC